MNPSYVRDIANQLICLELTDKDALYLIGVILTRSRLSIRIEADFPPTKQNVTANKPKQNKTKRTKQ